MFTKFDSKSRMMGFGNTEEEAIEELNFNKARVSIKNDETGYYAKRREELFSWMPLPTLLAIRSIGSIVYCDGYLENTVTKKRIKIKPKALSHYLYLYSILDGKISFNDFTITMSREVNKFLGNISPEFGTLDEFPYIKPGDLVDATDIHYLSCGGFICDTRNGSILVCNDQRTLSIDLIDGVDKECLIAYGLAKLGISYNGQEAFKVASTGAV